MESDPALLYECPEIPDVMKLYIDVFSVGKENFLLSFIKLSDDNLSTCLLGTLYLLYNEDGTVTPTRFVKLEKCTKSKSAFIVLSILLRFPDGTGHSLCLIVDNRRLEVEFFDSNGIKGYWWKAVNEYLEVFSSDNFPNHEYISMIDFCPIGPQYLAQDDYCNLWNLLYIYLRLKYPVRNRKLIVEYLLKNRNRAISFLCYLDDYATKHKMYQAIGIIQSLVENMVSDSDIPVFLMMEKYRIQADYDSIIELARLNKLNLII